jgi:hypothetical protein
VVLEVIEVVGELIDDLVIPVDFGLMNFQFLINVFNLLIFILSGER